ncbi:MAG: helix-turn-helix transcriptional regulator [Clostridium sp.]|nr:helix-turn-helix transcriptional regulator [Clostridium sp.]
MPLSHPYGRITTPELDSALQRSGNHIALMDRCGFFLCKEGEVEVTLNDQEYRIRKGDLYIYVPMTLVQIRHRSNNLQGLMYQAETDFIAPALNTLIDTRNRMFIREHPCVSLTARQQERIEQLTDLIRQREKLSKEPDFPPSQARLLRNLIGHLAQALCGEIVMIYCANQPIEPLRQDKKDRIFHRFMLSVSKHYRKEREVGFYANEQCLTPRYFSSLIKEKSGYTASQWIVQTVIHNAKMLLERSDLSIKDIALTMNFPSLSFFGKYFKQYTGMSPKAYRKNLLQVK